MPVFKNEGNETWYVMARYVNWKGERKQKCKTDLSQGIVVRAENEDDYFIVMECSRLNEGFKYTQIILTLGGCL